MERKRIRDIEEPESIAKTKNKAIKNNRRYFITIVLYAIY